jgi:ParB family chromosome partitioning protein
MTQVKGGLGRGLSALLPQEASVRDISLDEIRPNPRQPRKEIDADALNELAASIAAVGLLQPVVVRRADIGYELVVGERRWRAARIAGLERIPAVVRETDDGAMLRDALIENLQRVDLDPLEEAAAYRQLLDELGVTHEELAARVGKSRVAITNTLRLLNLAPEVQMRLASGAISSAHARAILALSDHAAQARVAARVVAEQLTVRETEELVRRLAASGQPLAPRSTPARAELPAGILEAERMLSDMLQTQVRIHAGRRRGRIEIDFAGIEDLDRIVRALAPAKES